MCVSLLLVRYNDVAGVWRSNLLVSQMDLTLATKTERDSDSESNRERSEEQKGERERGRQTASWDIAGTGQEQQPSCTNA